MRRRLFYLIIALTLSLAAVVCDTGTGADDGEELPGAPTLIHPDDGATDVELRPTFQWTDTDESRSTNTDSIGGVEGHSTPAAAVASVGNTGSAEPRIERNNDETPHTTSPSTEPAATSGGFHLQVDDDPEFNSPVIDIEEIAEYHYQPVTDLDGSTTYYWRVREKNADGFGAWSEVWSFTTGYEPPGWHIETVDTTFDVGRYSSLKLDTNECPHIACYHPYGCYDYYGDLKYTRWNGSSWEIMFVERGGVNVGQFASLALGSSSNPHISYHDSSNGDLKHAALDGSSWEIEIVDSNGHTGQHTSVALDTSDNPCISYQYNNYRDTLTLMDHHIS